MTARRPGRARPGVGESRRPRRCVTGVIVLWLGLPLAVAQETPDGAGTQARSGSAEGEAVSGDGGAATEDGAGPERDFTPSERISEDYSVDFPVDI